MVDAGEAEGGDGDPAESSPWAGRGRDFFSPRGGGGIVPLGNAPSDAAQGYKSKSCGLSIRS